MGEYRFGSILVPVQSSPKPRPIPPMGHVVHEDEYPHGPRTCKLCGSSRKRIWIFWRGLCLDPECPLHYEKGQKNVEVPVNA